MNSQGQPPVMVFNGPVGAVQTGANATAHVQQNWELANSEALVDALQKLRLSVTDEAQLDSNMKDDLVQRIDQTQLELKAEKPSKARLLAYLAGIGAVVQTVGSAQPAFEAVRAAAQALGLPF